MILYRAPGSLRKAGLSFLFDRAARRLHSQAGRSTEGSPE
jgi:hypothetical protein